MRDINQNSDWLIGVKAALRRAAINAKKEAECLGIPFIIAKDVDARKDIKKTKAEREAWDW